MNADPTSLANLRDLAEPSPVPWWPLAPGWWVLLGVLAVTTGWLTLRLATLAGERLPPHRAA